jgi:hypothetical protein
LVRLSFTIELRYEIGEQPADFVFNIHAARTPWQTVVSENVTLDPPLAHVLHTDPAMGNRYMRVRAGPGPLAVPHHCAEGLSTSSETAEIALSPA